MNPIGRLDSYGSDVDAAVAVTEALEEAARAEIARLGTAVRLHGALGRVLRARFAGKQVNARVVGLFREEAGLPEGEAGGYAVVQWRREYGRGYVRVWGVPGWRTNGQSSNQEVALDLEVGEEKELRAYDAEVFEKRDARNGENSERAMEELKKWMEAGRAADEGMRVVELARAMRGWEVGVEGGVMGWEMKRVLREMTGWR